MPTNTAVVSFGSNIDPEFNEGRARSILQSEHDLLDASRFYWTDPVGVTDQPRFLNGAYMVSTTLTKDDFRQYLKEVEDRLGRDRTGPKAGPRTADLDLLIWNGSVVHHDVHDADYVRPALVEVLEKNGMKLPEEEG